MVGDAPAIAAVKLNEPQEVSILRTDPVIKESFRPASRIWLSIMLSSIVL